MNQQKAFLVELEDRLVRDGGKLQDLSRYLNQEYCQRLWDRYIGYRNWRTLWDALVYFVGALFVIAIAFALLEYRTLDSIQKLVTTLSGIAGAGFLAWIVSRRTNAKQEEDNAFKEYTQDCKED